MKTKLFMISLLLGFSISTFAQTQGSYLSLSGNGIHHNLTKVDDNTILIESCQKFESQLSQNDETFKFKKMDSGQFGWVAFDGNVYGDVVMHSDSNTNTVSFPSPLNLNQQRSFKLMHTANSEPQNGVKTYIDETVGGYSNARILVTDTNQIKSGKCNIHSVEKTDANQFISGTFRGVFDESWSATFNSDHSGTFLGLPMRWSLVSDEKGNVINWNWEGNNNVKLFVMVEFTGEIPITFDPVAAGKKVAGIYSATYIADEGYVEIHQMQKKM